MARKINAACLARAAELSEVSSIFIVQGFCPF
jgi:hypothetical protein